MRLLRRYAPRNDAAPESCKYSKELDSGFRRNDGKTKIQTFYEIIRFTIAQKEKERQVISNLEPPASDPWTKRPNGVASIRDGKTPFFLEKKSGRINFLQ